MKVDPIKRQTGASGSVKRRGVARGEGKSFGDVLTSASAQQGAELEKLFGEIDESGRELRENPTLDCFHTYRDRVARFIKLFLGQAYDIKLTSEMTLTGRQRHLILVKKIDSRLEDLYHLFLQELLDIEELVKGVEEVRGMLLDLYK